MTRDQSSGSILLVAGETGLPADLLQEIRSLCGDRLQPAGSAEAALAAGQGAVLALLRDPARGLAARLWAAPDAAAALADWRHEAGALLHLRRSQRDRLHLLDPALFGPGGSAGLARLGDLLGGVRLEGPLTTVLPAPPEAVLGLAAALLAGSAADLRLAGALRAEMHRPGPETEDCGAETAGPGLALVDRALFGLRQDAQALALQRETLALQRAEIDRLAQGLIALEDSAGQARLEAGALQAEIAQLQAGIAAREGRISGLEAEIARIYASRSWRITAPLRGARRRMT